MQLNRFETDLVKRILFRQSYSDLENREQKANKVYWRFTTTGILVFIVGFTLILKLAPKEVSVRFPLFVLPWFVMYFILKHGMRKSREAFSGDKFATNMFERLRQIEESPASEYEKELFIRIMESADRGDMETAFILIQEADACPALSELDMIKDMREMFEKELKLS